jgi:tRNA(Ile)-lysidine synthase
LHALAHSRRKLDILAAHVDHGLRADSAADALRVAQLARDLGVATVEVQRVDVAAYRQGLPGWSVQQAARAVRYHVLAGIAHQRGASAVLVAHTADDQAETVLINLLRGAGLAGLAGMRMDETMSLSKIGPRFTDRSETVQTDHLRLARPLLRVSRSTTLAYCAELGLSIVEDTSNQSRAYTRNRVRLDLLPALERFNPAIRSVLARTADLAAEDLAALDDVVSNLHAELLRAQEQATDAIEYDLRLWRAQPRALQRRLLRLAVGQLLGDLVDVRASAIDDALALLASGTPAQTYHLSHGVELCIGPRTFVVRLHGRARAPARANTWGVEYPRV